MAISIRDNAPAADIERLRADVLAMPNVESAEFATMTALLARNSSENPVWGSAGGWATSRQAILVTLADPRQAKTLVELIASDPGIGVVATAPGSVRDLSAGWKVTVFLKDDAKARDVAALAEGIEGMANVDHVTFVSKQTALARFKENMKNTPAILEDFHGNPLPASLDVTLDDPRRTESVVQLIVQDPNLAKVVKHPSDPLASDIRYPRFVR